MTKLIIDLITSKNPLLEDSDPCWDNYKQIGLKKKNGKTVPNCVPEDINPADKGEYDNEGAMAKTQLRGIVADASHMIKMFSDEQNLPEWVQNKITKAADYLQSAHSYMMNKDEPIQEKTNMKKIKVSEKLSVSDGMGAWIKDFQDSDAPQFADADEDERRTMAIAAYLAAKRESKKGAEKEADQVDELKTGTLLRYASKAGKDALSKGIEAGRARDMGDSEAAAALRQKSYKRYTGQNQALSKIRNKTTKEAKQVDEETISEAVRVHVNDGSNYDGKQPSKKAIDFIEKGVDRYNGKFDGSSDKGFFVKFNSTSDSNGFISYIKRGEFSRLFYADVMEGIKDTTTESTSNYAQSANKILDDLKKANISAADKAKLAQLADLMAKMKDK
jgi:hypothetical protein